MGFEYEPYKLAYVQPEQKRTYLPDYARGNVILETKGIFSSADRKKMLLLKEQHPDKTFIMVFGQAFNKLSRKSSTTYASWCDKNDIPWCDLADFEKDPEACLYTITKKKILGKQKTLPKMNKSRSSKSRRK